MRSCVLALVVLVAACGGGKADPTEVRCRPHRTRELACADAEHRRGLELVGDLCQKVLNGKNTRFFGPGDVRRMERELACATTHQDCAAYRTCVEAAAEDPPSP